MKAFAQVSSLIAALLLAGCSHAPRHNPAVDVITEKLVLDFRYFCEVPPADGKCREPMTKLPQPLADLLAQYALGGVILFAENIDTIDQTVTLVHDLQQASLQSSHGTPLLITIDQEGGAVTRLPRDWSTPFAGSMAIAALPAADRAKYAYKVGQAIGAELRALGINVNHAPVLDVNSNPENPVINVRSFSDRADVVAKLGSAMAKGLSAADVAANAKHFPGHGNTAVDSHVGLPRVDTSRDEALRTDLAPFQGLINEDLLPLIMTAHIQYPSLDSTMIEGKKGEKILVPATLSRKIITNLLRDEMQFKGVVISDALNMKAISNFIESDVATLKTFEAGVDLALMPLAIRSPEDFPKLRKLIAYLGKHKAKHQSEWAHSVARIQRLKQDLQVTVWADIPLEEKVAAAHRTVGSTAHKELEQQLAAKALTFVKGAEQFRPVNKQNYRKIHIVLPDLEQAKALEQALSSMLGQNTPIISAHGYNEVTPDVIDVILNGSDLLITGSSLPGKSLADLGGMSDEERWKAAGAESGPSDGVLQLVKMAEGATIPSLFISFRFPFDLGHPDNQASFKVAAYNHRIQETGDGQFSSPTMKALAASLTGEAVMEGTVPIDIHHAGTNTDDTATVFEKDGLKYGAENGQ